MDGSITGFTELTASQHSTAPAILPAAAWTWVLALRWGAANRVYTGHVHIKQRDMTVCTSDAGSSMRRHNSHSGLLLIDHIHSLPQEQTWEVNFRL